MSDRERLPHRRETVRYALRIHNTTGRYRLYLDVGLYPDGRVGELFIVLEKTGTLLRAVMDSLARAVSKQGLQRGAPLQEIVEDFRGTKFPPFGVVTGHEQVRFCSSPLDAVAQVLEAEYGQDSKADPAADK